jgi:hypothetical protein
LPKNASYQEAQAKLSHDTISKSNELLFVPFVLIKQGSIFDPGMVWILERVSVPKRQNELAAFCCFKEHRACTL